MISKYNSLEELIYDAKKIIELPSRELANFSYAAVIDIFHESEKHVVSKTNEYSEILGFKKYKSTKMSCLRTHSGWCDYYGNITINIESIFGYNYDGFLLLLIHELCHTEIANHSKQFWTLFERSAKRIELLPQGYNGWTWMVNEIKDSPLMYVVPEDKDHHLDERQRRKYRIIRNTVCDTKSVYGEYRLREAIDKPCILEL